MTEREAVVVRLKKERPRDSFLRRTAIALGLLVAFAWWTGGFHLGDVTAPRRLTNFLRFLQEIQPYPLRDGTGGFDALLQWAWNLLTDRGWEAILTTLAISVAAIVLAGAGALVMLLPAARSFATAEPFLPSGREPGWRRILWTGLVALARGWLLFLRSLPEYVLAFLFLGMLGPQAWPAVLALALHNIGILGKLGAEVFEDADPTTPRALRSLGSRRRQIALMAVFPLAFPRLLVYFSYRWETCVREATVLGLLGFASLGYWIADARARDRYDEMVFFTLLASALLLIGGDLVSALLRSYVRRAT